MPNIVLFLLLFLTSTAAFSQENDAYAKKSFTIVISTKNYQSALKKAQKAANKLQIPMNLRNCTFDKENGLTNNETCGCGEKHGYLPRGRFDDGQYISIEYSSAFEGFTPDYYIVVVESGSRKELEKSFSTIQKEYSDAYIKDSPVYLGCMH